MALETEHDVEAAEDIKGASHRIKAHLLAPLIPPNYLTTCNAIESRCLLNAYMAKTRLPLWSSKSIRCSAAAAAAMKTNLVTTKKTTKNAPMMQQRSDL